MREPGPKLRVPSSRGSCLQAATLLWVTCRSSYMCGTCCKALISHAVHTAYDTHKAGAAEGCRGTCMCCWASQAPHATGQHNVPGCGLQDADTSGCCFHCHEHAPRNNRMHPSMQCYPLRGGIQAIEGQREGRGHGSTHHSADLQGAVGQQHKDRVALCRHHSTAGSSRLSSISSAAAAQAPGLLRSCSQKWPTAETAET